jgi:hypothetical protein
MAMQNNQFNTPGRTCVCARIKDRQRQTERHIGRARGEARTTETSTFAAPPSIQAKEKPPMREKQKRTISFVLPLPIPPPPTHTHTGCFPSGPSTIPVTGAVTPPAADDDEGAA